MLGRITVVLVGLAICSPALGGAYPVTKVWPATDPIKHIDLAVSDPINCAEYSGWSERISNGAGVKRTLTTIGGEQAELDQIALPEFLTSQGWNGSSVKLYYDIEQSDRPPAQPECWPGMNSTNGHSLTWRVNIIQASGSRFRIKFYTTNWRVRFEFSPALGDGCPVSGWTVAEGTITQGGRYFGSRFALPMSMNEWHDIRIDVDNNGDFDMWIDGGGSDWKHISGIASLSTSSDRLEIGVGDSTTSPYQWATSYLAWGEANQVPDEIPDPPPSHIEEEICNNGNLDDDGDTFADCADTDCDCTPIPLACLQVADVFEKFNVNFSLDPVVAGEVPPGWSRSGYDSPAYSDWDRNCGVDPTYCNVGRSFMKTDPANPNSGPHYWPAPGPYQEERDAAYAACMAGQSADMCPLDLNLDGDTSESCGNYPPIDAYCREWSSRAYHTTQPLRVQLDLYQIESQCGSLDPECISGWINVEREVSADDMALLPIDWSDPVTITVQAAGMDQGRVDGSVDTWETFLTYASGYDINSATTLEWGSDATPNATGPADYRSVGVELAAGQGGKTGMLVLGVYFDYSNLLPPPLPQKLSYAFFENVKITYTPDPTAVLLHLNKMAINHEIMEGGTLPPGDSFTVTNAGAGVMDYTVTDDAPWLELSSAGGSSSGESDQINLTYDVDELLPGDHIATITVDSPQNTKSAAILTVTVTVAGPSIALSETSFNHVINIGRTLDNDTFTVTNVGIGVLDYTISDDADWLSEAPDFGDSSGEPDAIEVVYDTAGLELGEHTATIWVTGNADNTPQTIDVTVLVTLNPPDYDNDGDVDQEDFGDWQNCFTGSPPDASPVEPGLCQDYADFNSDNYVDSQDYLVFEGCASGPDILFDPDCVQVMGCDLMTHCQNLAKGVCLMEGGIPDENGDPCP